MYTPSQELDQVYLPLVFILPFQFLKNNKMDILVLNKSCIPGPAAKWKVTY